MYRKLLTPRITLSPDGEHAREENNRKKTYDDLTFTTEFNLPSTSNWSPSSHYRARQTKTTPPEDSPGEAKAWRSP